MSEKIFKGNNIIVYDDILTEEEQNKLENLFFNKNSFPWYIKKYNSDEIIVEDNKNVVINRKDQEDYASIFKNNKNINEPPQMTHVFFQLPRTHLGINLPDKNVSDHFYMVNTLLNKVINYFKLKNLNLLRAKANLLFQLQNNQKSTHTTPHIDFVREHLVCIYYINNSDGDTHFFEEVSVPSLQNGNKNNMAIGSEYSLDHEYKNILAENEFKITKSISPKKGRFLFFKGNIIHANGNPIYNNTRMVMNIDFNI